MAKRHRKAKSKQDLPAGIYPRQVNGAIYFQVSLGRDENGKQRWKSCRTLEGALTNRQLFEYAKKQQGESLWLNCVEIHLHGKRSGAASIGWSGRFLEL